MGTIGYILVRFWFVFGYTLVRFWFVFGYTLVCFWFSFGSISVIEMAVSVEEKSDISSRTGRFRVY